MADGDAVASDGASYSRLRSMPERVTGASFGQGLYPTNGAVDSACKGRFGACRDGFVALVGGWD